MADKDPNNPSITSASYDYMLPKWRMIDAVLGGTSAMRRSEQLYLPKHAAETDTAYRSRLDCSVFYNVTEKTLSALVGKPFKESLPVDNVAPQITETIFPDVNLCGDNHEVFARKWFSDGIAKGYSHVLIDFPRLSETEGPRTLDDDRREKVRPYWAIICPSRVIDIRTDARGTLAHVRIKEDYTEYVGFMQVTRLQIRVLEPDVIQIWRPKKDDDPDGEWLVVEEWANPLGYIPMVTYFSTPCDNYRCTLPLEDLAYNNIAHWQSYSDQRHILTVSRFPMLAASGIAQHDSDKVLVGPNKVLFSPDPQGKYYFVETTGASIAAGSADLEALEKRMAQYGASFLEKRSNDHTATAKKLDSQEADSALGTMVMGFMDALANVLQITADWMNIDDGGHITIPTDFTGVSLEGESLRALTRAREMRDISRDAFVTELKNSKILRDDFDAEEDLERLSGEDLLGSESSDESVDDVD